MTQVAQDTSIDVERLAARGRQAIEAREIKAKEEAERRVNERREDLLKDWSPYVMKVLEALKQWLPVEPVAIGGFRVAGPGWTIMIPEDDYPYRGGIFSPVTLKLEGCMPIHCFSNKEGRVVFEAGDPMLLFDEEECRWYTHEGVRRWTGTWGDIGMMNDDLTVAIAGARDGFVEMLELKAEAERRNLNCVLPSMPMADADPDQPEAVDYLKEAKRMEELLNRVKGPSEELFQAGVVAALIAIGEELRKRHY